MIEKIRAHRALFDCPDALAEHLSLIGLGYCLQRQARRLNYHDGHTVLRISWVRWTGRSRLVVRGTFAVHE